MVKKSSKRKSIKPSKKLIRLNKEKKEITKFIDDTNKKITYFSKQISRANTNLDKIDKMIKKLE